MLEQSNFILISLGESLRQKKHPCLGPSLTLLSWKSFPYFLCCVGLQKLLEICALPQHRDSNVFADGGLSRGLSPSTPGSMEVEWCWWVVRLEGSPKVSQASPQSFGQPYLTSASHSSLPICSSINSTRFNSPGQNLLSWLGFSWIQPPQSARLSSSFLPGLEMAKPGWATGTTPQKNHQKATQGSTVPPYSHLPNVPDPRSQVN